VPLCRIFLMVVMFCLCGGDTHALTPVASNEFTDAVLLKQNGRYDEAEARCLEFLAKSPDEPAGKRLLAEIQTAREFYRTSPTDLQKQMQEVIIPELKARQATVWDVVNFLRDGQSVAGTKLPINIVWQAPEEFKPVKITLTLRDVPLADALKYVTESAGLRYRVEAHAIVIYSSPPAAPGNAVPHVKP
jgi:hypothetical protein